MGISKKKKKNTCRITLLFPIIPNGQHGKKKPKKKRIKRKNKNLEEVFTLGKTQGIPALPILDIAHSLTIARVIEYAMCSKFQIATICFPFYTNVFLRCLRFHIIVSNKFGTNLFAILYNFI